MTSLYKLAYEGTGGLQTQDGFSELRRWFENYKLDRDAEFADECEWLTIEEKKFQGIRRPGVRYVGTIGDVEMHGPRRTVLFETNAPAPPTFHRPAKFRPEPRRQVAHDSGTLTYDMLLETMDRIGLGNDRRRDMQMHSRSFEEFAYRVQAAKYKFEIERTRINATNWMLPLLNSDVLSGLTVFGIDYGVEKPSVPPPRRYRRN